MAIYQIDRLIFAVRRSRGPLDFFRSVSSRPTAAEPAGENKFFGALRILQKGHYGDRRLGSEYGETNFVKFAEAYGEVGLRVDNPKDLEPSVVSALASTKLTIMDVRIDPIEIAHRSKKFKNFHKF